MRLGIGGFHCYYRELGSACREARAVQEEGSMTNANARETSFCRRRYD
jgi:hypothetical protein